MSRLTTLSALLLSALGLVYALWVEPRWVEVTQHDLRQSGTADPIRVVQLSDLHLQAMGALETSVAGKVRQIAPDLVILSGDVIDRADTLPVLAQFLQALGDLPVIAVLGNWEYWSEVDLAALKEVYRSRPNTDLLINQVAMLQIRGRTVILTGLDDFTAGQPEIPAQNHPDVAVATILIQHFPGYFAAEESPTSRHRFDLCLSGHTHGGQITFFGLPIWTPEGSGPYGSGLYHTLACRLYVSRGIGTSILPLRLGARPEIPILNI
jgi:predicted MPP superfamily phosphohydrolase